MRGPPRAGVFLIPVSLALAAALLWDGAPTDAGSDMRGPSAASEGAPALGVAIPSPTTAEEAVLVGRGQNVATRPPTSERTMTAVGTVIDAESGRPISGARVTVGEVSSNPLASRRENDERIGRSFDPAVTDSLGRFRAAYAAGAGMRVLRAEAAGFRTVWKTSTDERLENGVSIRLPPGGVVEGVVLDSSRRGVEGARVLVRLDESVRVGHSPRTDVIRVASGRWEDEAKQVVEEMDDAWASLEATTDARGRYRIEGLGLGERYAADASADGYSRARTVRDVRATLQAPLATADLTLQSSGRVVVRCRGADGAPAQGCGVRLQRSGQGLAQVTDAQGAALFADVEPGSYDAHVTNGRSSVRVTVEAVAGGEVDVAVDLPPPGSRPAGETTGTVASQTPATNDDRPRFVGGLMVPEGAAPPPYFDICTRSGNTMSCSGGPWSPDASSVVRFGPSGHHAAYSVEITAPGFLPVARACPGGPSDLGVIVLDAGEALHASVVDRGGIALRDALVCVDSEPIEPVSGRRVASSSAQQATTDARGEVTLRGLRRGRSHVRITDERFLPFDAIVEVPVSERVHWTVDRGSLVRIRVVDAEGHALPRLQVSIHGGGGMRSVYGRTDVEGLVTVRLGAGRYDVTAAHTGHESDGIAAIEVSMDGTSDREVRIVLPPR